MNRFASILFMSLLVVAGCDESPTAPIVPDKDQPSGAPVAAASIAGPENTPPSPQISGPSFADEGQVLVFSGAGSSDMDNDPLTYSWNFGDGSPVETGPQATHETRTHTYADEGNGFYSVRLTVNDGTASESSDLLVFVGNVAPTATFVAPATAQQGAQFQLALTNPRDASGDLPGLRYQFDCGTGSYGAASSSATATCTAGATGTITVRGRIADQDGGSTEYTGTVVVTAPAPVPTCDARLDELMARLTDRIQNAPRLAASRKAALLLAVKGIPAKVSRMSAKQKQGGIVATQFMIGLVRLGVDRGMIPADIGAGFIELGENVIAVYRSC